MKRWILLLFFVFSIPLHSENLIPNRTFLSSKKLQLRPDGSDNNIRLITRKSEAQGIHDMREILETATKEAAWIYLPETQTWIQTDTHQKATYWENDSQRGLLSAISISIDPDLTVSLGLVYKNATAYHIHPHVPFVETDLNRSHDEINKRMKELGIKSLRKNQRDFIYNGGLKTYHKMIALYKATIFSVVDVKMILVHSQVLLDFPEIEFKHKVTSSLGVVEFMLTEKGKTDLKLNGLNPILSEETNRYSNVSKDQIYKFIELAHSAFEKNDISDLNTVSNLQKRVQDLCQKLSSDRIQFVFTPHLVQGNVTNVSIFQSQAAEFQATTPK